MQILASAALLAAVSIGSMSGLAQAATTVNFNDLIGPRSEERRVGKECA